MAPLDLVNILGQDTSNDQDLSPRLSLVVYLPFFDIGIGSVCGYLSLVGRAPVSKSRPRPEAFQFDLAYDSHQPEGLHVDSVHLRVSFVGRSRTLRAIIP